MLSHYLDEISKSEFSERNTEIPRLVSEQKNKMNSRGIPFSTETLKAVANFFAAEFNARCDFVKSFLCSHSNMLSQNCDDIITEAKNLFQKVSFSERDRIKILYESSVKSIEDSLSNAKMKKDIKEQLISRMEQRIKKNNLYIELAYKEILAAKGNPTNRWLLLQPNFSGIGIDLKEIWNKFFKT